MRTSWKIDEILIPGREDDYEEYDDGDYICRYVVLRRVGIWPFRRWVPAFGGWNDIPDHWFDTLDDANKFIRSAK